MNHDFGPLPEVHPRHILVDKAKTDLMSLLIEWRERWKLTRAEELLLLAEAMSWDLKRAVQQERSNKQQSKEQ